MNETRLGVAAYLKKHRERLELLEKMWSDPLVQCYNDKDMPSREELIKLGAVFLVGPTSRHQILEHNYRCEEVACLREAEFKGYIYVPEPRGLEESGDFTERGYIHWWESNRLWDPQTLPVAWIPRDADDLLGLNTNWESAMFVGAIDEQLKSGKLDVTKFLIGWPDTAERMGLPRHYTIERVGLKRYDSLRRLCYAVVGKIPPDTIDES